MWGTTWLDEVYVQVVAFVLGGGLASTFHIIKNNEISKHKPRKPGFPRKQPGAGALFGTAISEQCWEGGVAEEGKEGKQCQGTP